MEEVDLEFPPSNQIQGIYRDQEHTVSFSLILRINRPELSSAPSTQSPVGHVGEGMLHEWYQPGRNSIWSEKVAFEKLKKFQL